ncbi:hypothetical protein [Clostridium akagii]|uniref:hypothetical protein n=1 Tax=Clostridium akagii TaxID=91623 RepID=UPI00056729ED|nr:hypothetical protein [Clostridium akagii]
MNNKKNKQNMPTTGEGMSFLNSLDAIGVYIGVPGHGMSYRAKFKTISANKLNTNSLFIGEIGQCRKINIFKELEFKKELAPKNVDVENFHINGEKFVKMTY